MIQKFVIILSSLLYINLKICSSLDLTCDIFRIYNDVQIYGRLRGLEFFQHDPWFLKNKWVGSETYLGCSGEAPIFRDENERTTACRANHFKLVYCTDLIFSQNRGKYLKEVEFIELFFENSTCKSKDSKARYLNIGFANMVHRQEFVLLTFILKYTCTKDIEFGMNLLLNSPSDDADEKFIISDTLCRLLGILNVTNADNCKDKQVEELILSGLGKNQENYEACELETIFNCTKMIIEKLFINNGTTDEITDEITDEKRVAFYCTCVCLLVVLILLGVCFLLE